MAQNYKRRMVSFVKNVSTSSTFVSSLFSIQQLGTEQPFMIADQYSKMQKQIDHELSFNGSVSMISQHSSRRTESQPNRAPFQGGAMPPPLNLNNLKIQDQSVMQTSDRGFRIYGGRGAVTAKNTNASLRNLPASTLAATTLGRPRTMRVVDNPEESRLKNINKHSQLDTTPNLDINEAWRKMIRKREPE